jgi:hypothetical protein
VLRIARNSSAREVLCMGNCVVYRMALVLQAGRLGQGFQPDSDRPTAEVI